MLTFLAKVNEKVKPTDQEFEVVHYQIVPKQKQPLNYDIVDEEPIKIKDY
jgi:hypothetical protein